MITALSGTAQDVKYGLRLLRRNIGFTIIAALTLALGIGANTAIFSVAHAFLTQPLPFPELDRISAVVIGQKAPVTPADYFDWKTQSHSFEELAAYRQRNVNLTGGGAPEREFAAQVTADFFAALRATPAMGRTFSTGEDQTGRGDVVILGYGLWQRRFGSDANIVGRAIDLDGKPFTVAGVMPREFDFPAPTDLWVPLALTPQEKAERSSRSLHVIGRLSAGVSQTQAQAEMTTISRQLELAYPATNKSRVAHVMPLAEFVEGTIVRAAIFMLLCAVGVVLLIACANIANLQLARATGREREIAVRTALGASRLRIVRLLLWENLLLGAIGGAASLLFSGWCLTALLQSMPADVARLMPGFQTIRLDGRAMTFTMAIAFGAGILFGMAPALGNSRADLNDGLKEGSRGATASRAKQRLRSVFVVAQVSVALVLLVMAGIYVRTFRAMLHTGDVYAPQQVLVMGVNLPETRYADAAARARFYRAAIERLSAMPGTQASAAFTSIPMSNNGVTWSAFQIEGRPEPDEAHVAGSVLQDISPEFLKFMRISLVAGREFNAADTESTVPVALVSQKLAERYFPRESALGKRISVGSAKSPGPQLTIVGIVGNALYDWTDRLPEAVIYRPVSQSAPAETQLGIRVNGDPSGFVGAVRTQLAALDPLLPAYDVMPLNEAIDESLSGNPQLAGMMTILGGLALLIAIVGVYGIVAYAVAQRMHEFGVRMALGAEKRDIFLLVMKNGALLTMAGLAIGIPSALYLTRSGGELLGGTQFDFVTFFTVPVLLMAVTLLACYVPAARATRVDPIQALRYE